MKKIRIISDLHGNSRKHREIIKDSDYSIQIGDLGFNYSYLGQIDGLKHKVFRGNHDHVGMQNHANYLGEYGYFDLNGVAGYFISGAHSIDRAWRKENVNWWSDEQLSYMELVGAYDLYQFQKPEFVLSHDCPASVSKIIGNPEILNNFGHNPETYTNATQECLEECFEFRQPKLWIFGHYHIRKELTIGRTKFICLPEFGYCDVDENLDVTRLYTN